MLECTVTSDQAAASLNLDIQCLMFRVLSNLLLSSTSKKVVCGAFPRLNIVIRQEKYVVIIPHNV